MTDTRPEVPIEEQIAYVEQSEGGHWRITTAEPVVSAILASLLELQRIRSAERPEPVATVYDAYDSTGIDWHCKDAPPTGMKIYGPELLAAYDRMRAERDAAVDTDWYLRAKRSGEMAKAWEREARESKVRAEAAESKLARVEKLLREPSEEMIDELLDGGDWRDAFCDVPFTAPSDAARSAIKAMSTELLRQIEGDK